MKTGLMGAAQSGKTTLFNALTALHRAGTHAHIGAIKVPDERLEKLAAHFLVRKTAHAEIIFVDPPSAGARGAEGLKAHADADALCLVLRAFRGPDGRAPDPLRQLRDLEDEIIAADLAIVDHRLDHLRKMHGGRTGGEFHELETIRQHLAAGRPLRTLSLSEAERQALGPFGLSSLKPMLVVLNVDEGDAGKPVPAELEAEQRAHGAESIAICATLEAEIAELDPAEQPAFLASLGLSESVRDRFIHATYHLLDLLTFFTVGEDEVRALTLHRGDKAPRAAARIRPDLEGSFSRIEVTSCDEIVSARDKGRSHLEGKEYVVRDGDLLRVRPAH